MNRTQAQLLLREKQRAKQQAIVGNLQDIIRAKISELSKQPDFENSKQYQLGICFLQFPPHLVTREDVANWINWINSDN